MKKNRLLCFTLSLLILFFTPNLVNGETRNALSNKPQMFKGDIIEKAYIRIYPKSGGPKNGDKFKLKLGNGASWLYSESEDENFIEGLEKAKVKKNSDLVLDAEIYDSSKAKGSIVDRVVIPIYIKIQGEDEEIKLDVISEGSSISESSFLLGKIGEKSGFYIENEKAEKEREEAKLEQEKEDLEKGKLEREKLGTLYTKESAFKLNEKYFFVKTNEKYERVTMDVAPFAENGRTYLPIKYAAMAFNLSSEYNNEYKKVVLKNNENNISIFLKTNTIRANGKDKKLENKIIEKGGRTFLPIYEIEEGLNKNGNFKYSLSYDKDKKQVLVKVVEKTVEEMKEVKVKDPRIEKIRKEKEENLNKELEENKEDTKDKNEKIKDNIVK